MKQSYAFYDRRRKELIERIKQKNPQVKKGMVILLAAFEDKKHTFRQSSAFYYYTGISEPGLVLCIDFSGTSRLFIPAYKMNRSDWLPEGVAATKECAQKLSMSDVLYRGEQQPGYEAFLCADYDQYRYLIEYLKSYIDASGTIFTYAHKQGKDLIYATFLMHMSTFLPTLMSFVLDITQEAAVQRAQKNKFEIEILYKAVELTMVAQEAAARVIEPGIKESLITAGIGYIFAEANATPAFPSIVATGKHTTVLHYHNGETDIKPNDLVVVDIGAEYEHYCADITRTYPASGTFTKRQRQVYEAVLATHEYTVSIAKPGMYLRNDEKPDRSLHHLAVAHLEKKGFARYFKHGIGHYLGLDVHDVGDYSLPLEEGNVITIEPGIYIPEEQIGIRIEDDYWIVADGVECLSAELPRDVESIQDMARASIDDDADDDDLND